MSPPAGKSSSTTTHSSNADTAGRGPCTPSATSRPTTQASKEDLRERIVMRFKRIPVRTTVRASTTPHLTLSAKLQKHYRVCKAGQLASGKSDWQQCGLCRDLLNRRGYIRDNPPPAVLSAFAQRTRDARKDRKEMAKKQRNANPGKSTGSSRK